VRIAESQAPDRHVVPSQIWASPISIFIGFFGGILLLILLLHALPNEWGMFSLVPIGLFILLSSIPGMASIYPDHVRFWWMGWSRRVDAADILGMERYAFAWRRARFAGATFHLRAGRQVRVVLGQGQQPPFAGRGDDLADHIFARMKGAEHRSPAFDLSRLLRGGLPIHDWISVLRSLGAAMAAQEEDAQRAPRLLVEIAEESAHAPWARAAAAVAIGPLMDEAGCRQLEAAALLIIDESLQAVFMAVSTRAPDDELARLLAPYAGIDE
jgi:hypothetical protein